MFTTEYIQTLKISVISVISNDNKKITKTSRSIKTKKYGMEEYGTKDFLYLEEYTKLHSGCIWNGIRCS